MKTEQMKWTEAHGWAPAAPGPVARSAPLALVFGSTSALRNPAPMAALRRACPAAHLFGCSTAGEICGTRVSDDSLVVTAVQFAHTAFHGTAVRLGETPDSSGTGEKIAQQLPPSLPNPVTGAEEKLAHVLVLSDGLKINGGDLVAGAMRHLPADITLTGGMAGDGARFGETLVFRDNVPATHTVAALGLYGHRLKVGFGSLGGWDCFGTERLVTKARANVLYELDGRSALGLYKQYLGEHAQGLPSTGLLFPLSIRLRPGETPVVRTILSVDETTQSLTFAGNIPEGAYARLMKANFDRLIDGATGAAQTSHRALRAAPPELALLISCVGRKLVLKQRIEEEVEAVRDVLGGDSVLAGFYSYGEFSPFTPGAKCELHNQTMTITALAEE